MLGLDVVDGELSDGDAVFDKSIPICAVLLGSGVGPRAHVLLAGDEVPRGEVGDRVAFQANGVVEVELLETLRAGTGQSDPVLAALRVSGGDLALRAGRQVFLVCQGFPAGPLTEAGPPILAGWAAFNVRVGRLALFHLGFGSRPHQREPPLSQRLRGPHMGRVSDRLVPAQAIDGSATRSPHTRPGPRLVGTSTRRPTTLGSKSTPVRPYEGHGPRRVTTSRKATSNEHRCRSSDRDLHV